MTRRVEIHLHVDTLQTRHHILRDGESPFRFHSGFSQADVGNGWKQVSEIGASSDEEIETAKAEAVAFSKQYWEDLLERCAHVRVVQRGMHHVAHPVGVGIGFNGQAFRIHWLDSSLAPTVCNLSAQGPIPAWMRDKMPDNAIISEVAA